LATSKKASLYSSLADQLFGLRAWARLFPDRYGTAFGASEICIGDLIRGDQKNTTRMLVPDHHLNRRVFWLPLEHRPTARNSHNSGRSGRGSQAEAGDSSQRFRHHRSQFRQWAGAAVVRTVNEVSPRLATYSLAFGDELCPQPPVPDRDHRPMAIHLRASE